MTSGDEVDIRSGALVAVDTETLRAAAARLLLAAAECDGIVDTLGRAAQDVWSVSRALPMTVPVGAADGAAARARRIAADLLTMADMYEAVELAAAAAAASAAGEQALAAELTARAAIILAGNPAALPLLARSSAEAATALPTTLGTQFGEWGPLRSPHVDGAALLLVGLIGALGFGVVPAGTQTPRNADAVTVTALRGGRTTAPTGLSQVAGRVPQGDGRLRVERYTMADGSRQFVAYVAGTAGDGPDDEAFDMASNLSLYPGRGGASYDAVLAALDDAGAQRGDAVSLAGYSQGAMDASLVALSGRYEVPMLVTFGSPVQADVGDATLSVALRHGDDVVSALAAGGYAAGVGAAGSFVASREPSGTLLTGDSPIAPHAIAEYRRTAELLDGSTDPRMVPVRERLEALARAESVEVTVYGAARTAPVVDGGDDLSACGSGDAG